MAGTLAFWALAQRREFGILVKAKLILLKKKNHFSLWNLLITYESREEINYHV